MQNKYQVAIDEDDNWIILRNQPTTTETQRLESEDEHGITEHNAVIPEVEKPVVFEPEQWFRHLVLFSMFIIGAIYFSSALGEILPDMKSPPLLLLLLIVMAGIAMYLLEPKRFQRNGEAFKRNFEELNDAYEAKIEKMKNWRKS